MNIPVEKPGRGQIILKVEHDSDSVIGFSSNHFAQGDLASISSLHLTAAVDLGHPQTQFHDVGYVRDSVWEGATSTKSCKPSRSASPPDGLSQSVEVINAIGRSAALVESRSNSLFQAFVPRL